MLYNFKACSISFFESGKLWYSDTNVAGVCSRLIVGPCQHWFGDDAKMCNKPWHFSLLTHIRVSRPRLVNTPFVVYYIIKWTETLRHRKKNKKCITLPYCQMEELMVEHDFQLAHHWRQFDYTLFTCTSRFNGSSIRVKQCRWLLCHCNLWYPRKHTWLVINKLTWMFTTDIPIK